MTLILLTRTTETLKTCAHARACARAHNTHSGSSQPSGHPQLLLYFESIFHPRVLLAQLKTPEVGAGEWVKWVRVVKR